MTSVGDRLSEQTEVALDGDKFNQSPSNVITTSLLGKMLHRILFKTALENKSLYKYLTCVNHDGKQVYAFSHYYKVYPKYIMVYMKLDREFKTSILRAIETLFTESVLVTIDKDHVDNFFTWLKNNR